MNLLHRRPRPFVPTTRRRLRAMVTALETQRDLALGRERATRDRVAAQLTTLADQSDVPGMRHVASELHALADRIEEGH